MTAVSGQTVARRAAMSAFIWTIGGLAVIGLLVGVGSSPILRAARPAAAHPVGESVPTTFGIVAVEHRELIAGIDHSQVGPAHNSADVADDSQTEVSVSATLTNQTSRVVSYSPRQFRLLAGADRRPVPLSHASVVDGTLQPETNVNLALSFVVARDGGRITFEFKDLDGRRIFVDLGSVDRPGAR